jgi:hypothetical protein
MMPITLRAAQTVAVSALLDTGAAVDVLPCDIGLQLGFIWDQQTTTVELTGNLSSVEARVVLMTATVAQLPPVRLAFAWAKQDTIPVILGQVNFFMVGLGHLAGGDSPRGPPRNGCRSAESPDGGEKHGLHP